MRSRLIMPQVSCVGGGAGLLTQEKFSFATNSRTDDDADNTQSGGVRDRRPRQYKFTAPDTIITVAKGTKQCFEIA